MVGGRNPFRHHPPGFERFNHNIDPHAGRSVAGRKLRLVAGLAKVGTKSVTTKLFCGPNIIRLPLIFTYMDTLAIFVTRQAGGLNFSLRPWVRRQLHDLFPEATVLPNIFVGHTLQQTEATLLAHLPKHIVPALTGLTDAQLAEIQQVDFIDTSNGQSLGEYIPRHVAA